jgi:hypothetical protein
MVEMSAGTAAKARLSLHRVKPVPASGGLPEEHHRRPVRSIYVIYA